jgi:DNA-binding transcriptional regulator YiaG
MSFDMVRPPAAAQSTRRGRLRGPFFMRKKRRRAAMKQNARKQTGRHRCDAGMYVRYVEQRRGRCIEVPDTIDVRKIRRRLRLSTPAFAARYGFTLAELRDWEQGRARPDRSACLLLRIIAKEPEVAQRALSGWRRTPLRFELVTAGAS